MTPQFTYDNKGNAVGVFLPIEDWNNLKKNLPEVDELPQWQKDILDQRMMLIQQDQGNAIPLEDFFAEMEKEANEEI
jgi:hypothetical protein